MSFLRPLSPDPVIVWSTFDPAIEELSEEEKDAYYKACDTSILRVKEGMKPVDFHLVPITPRQQSRLAWIAQKSKDDKSIVENYDYLEALVRMSLIQIGGEKLERDSDDMCSRKELDRFRSMFVIFELATLAQEVGQLPLAELPKQDK